MKRFYFKGKPPSRPEDDDSDSDDNPLQPPPSRPPSPTRRRKRIDAKVLNSQLKGDSPRNPRQGRKRIEAKVLETDSVPSEAVSLATNVGAEESVKHLSKFEPLHEKKGQTKNLGSLPELCLRKDVSSSESSESSDDSESLSSDEEEPITGISPKEGRTDEKVLPPVPAQAPVYVPSVARADAILNVTESKERRSMERALRKQTVREQTLRSAKHTVGETEYDLKYFDMSKFPDDIDRLEDREEEYERWRVRELKRVMADRGIDVEDESIDVSSHDEVKNVGPFFAGE